MSIISVLLADDHTIVRQGLRALLESNPGINVVGEATDGREALQKTEQLLPDIVVMDFTMPGLNGLEATRQIKRLFPQVKVLILSMHANEEYVFQTLRVGASGYVVKQAATEELMLAIAAVYRGESYLSPAVSGRVIEKYVRQAETARTDSYEKLTAREREVLQLIAEARPMGEIAEVLSISEKTVRAHKANLMAKLDIRTTAEMIRYAIRKGVVSPDL